MRSILITRPQPVADEFASLLRREGYIAYVAPLMEYAEVKADLSDVTDYHALIFTSAQAVRSFCDRMPDRDYPVFAVGDTTAQTAVKAGFIQVYSAKGGGEEVGALIREKSADLPLTKILHLCSEDTPEILGPTLSRLGIKVVRRVIYKAVLIARFPEDVLQALRHNTIDTVTLLSARTAAHFVHLMRQKELRGISAGLEAVCLSDRVAAELKAIPWRSVRVAPRPDVESLMAVLKTEEQASPDHFSIPNRRERSDRRQRQSVYDEKGNIRDSSYVGPDRRTGIDRRAHQIRQQERVMQERMKFLNHSVLTFSFMFIAVVLAGAFLMGPEFIRFGSSEENTPSVREGADTRGDPYSFGALWDALTSRFWQTSAALSATADEISIAARDDFSGNVFQGLSRVLNRIDSMRHSAEGNQAVERSLGTLRAALAGSSGDPVAINKALQKAKRDDKVLNSILGQVGPKDLAAAALLVTLSVFRSNVDNQRPFADDMALLQKFAGNDPEMLLALERLAPYAQRGIRGREALEAEFNGLAGDIIMAQLQGRDISVKEQALLRFQNLSQKLQVEDVRGRGPEYTLARARLLLRNGDVKGAVRELETLEGASARAAEPWMNDAMGHVRAGPSSDILTRGILQSMPAESGFSIDSVFQAIKESTQNRDVIYLSPGLKRGNGNYDGVLAPTAP